MVLIHFLLLFGVLVVGFCLCHARHSLPKDTAFGLLAADGETTMPIVAISPSVVTDPSDDVPINATSPEIWDWIASGHSYGWRRFGWR